MFEDGDIFGDGMNVAAARVGKSRFAIDGGCFRRSGTDDSNPVPSSRESTNHRFLPFIPLNSGQAADASSRGPGVWKTARQNSKPVPKL